MNDTPTPRTDALEKENANKDVYASFFEMRNLAWRLEHELHETQEANIRMGKKLAQTLDDLDEARAQRDALAMSYGELIAGVRVNARRGTFSDATVEQIDEWLKPWVDKLAAVKGETK